MTFPGGFTLEEGDTEWGRERDRKKGAHVLFGYVLCPRGYFS